MEHQLSLSSDNYIELVLCLVFELIREMRMGISTKMKPCDMIWARLQPGSGNAEKFAFSTDILPFKTLPRSQLERVNDGKAAYKLQ